ncbi:MAG: hypothetical protein FXF47_05615 [Candidatus Mcinerneyibacterium aminivorans]|uniref:Uncharacterized protein n=1 Tax=Candidatus Mcinerneyibacterium aminivorans TaxID=2703815 RepID=A0A5D0MGU6_9BACT|nr:MAG: hypothetical protein FXF47_05615 [Candidatus Mcinerneyibacterium aminivorans]
MKLKREKIWDFDIPENVLKSILDNLENGLKKIETELDEETVYLVINNIIKGKFEYKNAYVHMPADELLRLTKKIIKGSGNKRLLPRWTITKEKRKEIENREPMSDEEFYRDHY